MKTLNILQDFNQINLSSRRHVDTVLKQIEDINFGNESIIELNLEGCQTDYPETPRFIDFFLNYLAKTPGNKEFKIKFNGLGNKELYILHDIILEGAYFNIHSKIESENDINVWRDTMTAKLKEDNIVFEITYTPSNDKYVYGK